MTSFVLVIALALAQQIPGQAPRTSALQGLVTDETGRGLPGVAIVLKQGARDIARATTGGDGVFRMLSVAPGEYVLSLAREGYTSLEQGGLRVSAASS